MTTSSLNAFLKLACNYKKSLHQSNYINRVVNIIIGNESCDLDSATSSIVYAYFLYWSQLKDSPLLNDICIPIMNINKCDLPLKTEVIYSLRQNNISCDEILCRDEMSISDLVTLCKLRLILVDHHILAEKDLKLINNVVQIFDHRPKDQGIDGYNASTDINIYTVGSCSTLIASKIFDDPLGSEFFNENPDCANLIYGTIILDTVNFSPAADKAKPQDVKVSQMLENLLKITDPQTQRQKIFDELLSARIDHSSLNAFQLLRRDMKIINNIPIPGFPMLVKNYLLKDGCEKALEKFSNENNSPILLLMGLEINDGVVARDIAVFSVDQNNAIRMLIEEALLSSTEPNLGLQQKCIIKNCTHYDQLNTKASRKQIIPIIKRLLDS